MLDPMPETLIDIIHQLINGLMYGASYALIGLGFTLFFGVMKKFNIAYGPTIMVGIYLGLIPYMSGRPCYGPSS